MAQMQVEDDAYTLLCRMRELEVDSNTAEIARARTMVRLYQHYSADVEARRAADPRFTATPLTETIVETQPVTGQTHGRIRADLEAVLLMDQHLPWLATYVDRGWLDLYRATPVTNALKDELADRPTARQRFSELMEQWFDKVAAFCPVLCNKTIDQIRNHVDYVITKLLAGEADDRFKRRHARRRVSSTPTGDGMASLTVDTDQVSVKLADHHLDLLAREARSTGDERPLEQLRADLAIELLTGKRAVDGMTGKWARPIINVTVPIQTLMGLSDEPGRMGDEVLPASLVRHVAADPTSTWYRMLTDRARACVELSTDSYTPTAAIWRQAVAAQPTCFAPTCTKPAAECELDHRDPYPRGATSTENLGGACTPHHFSKHVRGSSLKKQRDGTLRYTTRSGMTHIVLPDEQPVCEDPEVGPLWERLLERQPTATQLLDALEIVRHHAEVIDVLEAEAANRMQEERDYRLSYPQASDEDIEEWVWRDRASAPDILRRMPRRWDQAPEPPELSRLVS